MKAFVFILYSLFILGCSKSDEINIIYSSDIWGETSHCGCPGHPTGGLPRKASFIKEVKKQHKGIYYFEIGDTFFRPGINLEQAKNEIKKVDMFIEAFNKMELDVFVPGENDLILGVDLLRNKIEKQRFKTVLSNLVKKGTNETVFEKSFIDKRYGRKICLFSLISPDLYKSNEYEVLEPISLSKNILKDFKKLGCEFNILLSHLGYNGDINFLKEMGNSEIDLLIGSHDGGWMSSPRKDGNVLVVYGYRRGQAVGHIGFVGSLNTKQMKDATQNIENKTTMAKFEKELQRIVEPAKGKDPEEFFKNDSTTLMKIRMLREQISELKKQTELDIRTSYYFNRVVSMDTAFEDDKDIERLVKEIERK